MPVDIDPDYIFLHDPAFKNISAYLWFIYSTT